MAVSNRAQIIGKVHTVLKKHYKPVTPTTRSLMENLLFACCLEDAHYEPADEVFSRVQESYFDWNEVRVTTVRELAEVFKGVPNAAANALNLKDTLQSVFESQYAFDLESLKRLNLGKAVTTLQEYKGTTQFTVAYVTQMNLGGHSIPLGTGGVDTFFIVGAIDEKEASAGTVPGLERAIPKSKGLEFGSLLHQFAADLVASPFSQKVRGILLEIAPDCKPRLPKRIDRKKLEAERRKKEEEEIKKKKAEEAAARKAEEDAKKAAAKKIADEKKAAEAKKAAIKKAAADKKAAIKKAAADKKKAAAEKKKAAAEKKKAAAKKAAEKKKAAILKKKAAKKKAAKKKVTKKKVTKKTATKKSKPTKKKAAKKKAKKKTTKKKAKTLVKKAKKRSGKKSASKDLARRKPR